MSSLARAAVVMASLAFAVVACAFIPPGVARDVVYDLVGLLAVSVAFWGLLRRGTGRRLGWLLVLSGFLAWVLGGLVLTLLVHARGSDAYPGPPDVLFFVAYGLIGAGLVVLVRRRTEGRDLTGLLDSAILATGVGVLAGVFVIAPVASDSSLSPLGGLTHGLYPIAGLVLLGMLVRLWATPGAKSVAVRLLSAALGLTLLGDVVHNLTAIAASDRGSSWAHDLVWLVGCVLVAGAAWAPSARDLAELVPSGEDLVDPRRPLLVLTGGLLLPATALLVDGLTGDDVAWPVIVAGSVLMSLLVVTRMGGLLDVVRVQAAQLAAMARSDPLTGLPNRRTWDYELARAASAAKELNAPLSVAVIDLDHFKQYNDSHGHPAGDLLLREAAAAWLDLLQPHQVLCRYGGEEFAILFPGQWAADVRPLMDNLQAVTPGGQTFSAGVATWDPDTDASAVVAAADQALYAAKRDGRNRVTLAPRPASRSLIPRPTMVLQPIVDLTTARPVGVEALSRFTDHSPESVFDEATRVGTGPTLEALAITYAIASRPAGLWLSVNVSIDAMTSLQVREALAGDLTGIVLEITEHADTEMSPDLNAVVADYRSRGASIAIDDWGRGYSNLDRLMTMKPDIVKLDMSLVHGLESEYHRAAIRSVTTWATMVGAQICAEGIETEEQWRLLRGFGVHLGQGRFFGGPSSTPPRLDQAAVSAVGL